MNRGKGDLRSILAPLAPQLRHLNVKVLEPVLYGQLHGVLGHQLEKLTVTGGSLTRISPTALTVSITQLTGYIYILLYLKVYSSADVLNLPYHQVVAIITVSPWMPKLMR